MKFVTQITMKDVACNKKYLGIDWGEKRIGLAQGDSETRMAGPFKVVGGLKEVLEIIKKEKINFVVIGQPFKMRGIELEMGKSFSEFFDRLKSKCPVPIFTVDERLSSLAADSLVGTKKTKASRDAIAAMLILQSYFDSNPTLTLP